MPNDKPPSGGLIQAAGAVAWRPGRDGPAAGPEILLVHRRRYDDWSLPKGKAEPGEPLAVTAVREVLEEGGARLTLGRRLGSVRYNVGGRPKQVRYWAARTTRVDERAVPNAEVDRVAWLPAAEAAVRASYSHDRQVLARFAAAPAATTPLILLRHAKAEPKSSWEGDDAARPLADSGRADAKTLAGLLACFAPDGARLVSSPAVRCTGTLRPFAELSGAAPRVDPSLAIGPSRTDPADYRRLLACLIAAGEPAVLCVHRENLLSLQAAALELMAAAGAGDEQAGGEPAGMPPGEWGGQLPTAGFWVLNVATSPAPEPRPVLVSADRYDLSDA